MSGCGARYWLFMKSFLGDEMCNLSWVLLLLTMGDLKGFEWRCDMASFSFQKDHLGYSMENRKSDVR